MVTVIGTVIVIITTTTTMDMGLTGPTTAIATGPTTIMVVTSLPIPTGALLA
jgi:hypothetical protein